MTNQSIGWIGLVGFLIIMIFIMTMFYGYLLGNWIDPSSCPKSYGEYGVIPGVIGNIVNKCNGPCEFTIPNLVDAVFKCNSDKNCEAFYYDGKYMKYIEINSPFTSANPGGLYIRQRKILRDGIA